MHIFPQENQNKQLICYKRPWLNEQYRDQIVNITVIMIMTVIYRKHNRDHDHDQYKTCHDQSRSRYNHDSVTVTDQSRYVHGSVTVRFVHRSVMGR
jgi:hypothetical protein